MINPLLKNTLYIFAVICGIYISINVVYGLFVGCIVNYLHNYPDLWSALLTLLLGVMYCVGEALDKVTKLHLLMTLLISFLIALFTINKKFTFFNNYLKNSRWDE